RATTGTCTAAMGRCIGFFATGSAGSSRDTMTDYVELRCRSAFSFLEGATLPEDLVLRAGELGYRAIALADRDGLYGAPRFFKTAAKIAEEVDPKGAP